jgi:hypothetical protein
MAVRVDVVPTEVVVTGVIPTYVAPTAEGISIPGTGDVIVHVKNTGASMTVTAQTPATMGGLAVAEQINTIAMTTGDEFMGRFPPEIYNQVSDGKVYLDFSRITDVTYAVLGV